MPLPGKRRVGGGKVVFAGNRKSAGAVRTIIAVNAGSNGGLPCVAFFTDPPNFLVAAVRDAVWRDGQVFFEVPLGD